MSIWTILFVCTADSLDWRLHCFPCGRSADPLVALIRGDRFDSAFCDRETERFVHAEHQILIFLYFKRNRRLIWVGVGGAFETAPRLLPRIVGSSVSAHKLSCPESAMSEPGS